MKTDAGKKAAALAAKTAKDETPAATKAVTTATTALDACYTKHTFTTATEKADAIKASGDCFAEDSALKAK